MTESNGSASGLTAATWWTVDSSHTPPLTRGATPLVERCIHKYGWTEAFVLKVLDGYKQFLTWKQLFEDWDDEHLCPPIPVGRMWYEHSTGDQHYEQDCQLLFGNVINRYYLDDTGRLRAENRMERVDFTKCLLQSRLGEAYDPEVWEFESEDGDMEREASSMADTAEAPPEPKSQLQVVSDSSDPNDMDTVLFSMHSRNTGLRVWFKVQKTHPMREAMEVFAERQGVDRKSLVFRNARGEAVVSDDATAESLGLHDRDEIVVDNTLVFRIRDERGEETFFRVRSKMRFVKAFTCFAERTGSPRNHFIFRRGGETIHDNDTAESIGLRENDTIDVVNNVIVVCVRDERGQETWFRVKKTQQVGILFRSFARRSGLTRTSLVFRNRDGDIIDDQWTVEMLQLQDRDTIFARIDADGFSRSMTSDFVVINIRDQSGGEFLVRLKRTRPLRTVFAAFAERQAVH